MSHSYICINIHYVFCTKRRTKIIVPELESRLYPYIGGIARENKMKALAISGTENHVHLLLSLPSTISIAKAIQLIKGTSSKWIHETFKEYEYFQWQEGYGAFSVGLSNVKNTIKYINNQKEHHRKHSFKEEYIAILKKHGIKYDRRYIW